MLERWLASPGWCLSLQQARVRQLQVHQEVAAGTVDMTTTTLTAGYQSEITEGGKEGFASGKNLFCLRYQPGG